MAQHDYVIANGTGAAVRSDLNNALSAIVSNNSGATEPTTTYAYQWWPDTTTGTLKLRNAANNAWITVGTLASANLGLLSSGGTITAALGSASTPGITFTGDTNTGIYSPGADQVAISTNGSGRLFVDSSGRVGIGVTPAGKFQINVATDTSLFNYSPASSVAQISALNDAGNSSREFRLDGSPLVFKVSDVEKARFTSTGLGIGTTSPARLLHVASSAADGAIVIDGGSSNAAFLDFRIAGTNKHYIGSANLLGSGTNSDMTVWNSANGYLNFGTNGTERFRCDSSGRLLVGTSTAVNTAGVGLLQVVGGDAARPVIHRNINDQYPPGLYFSKARGTGNQAVQNGDSVGFISFLGYDGAAGYPAATIEALIDATPGTTDMPGRLVFSTTADGASSPTERMRITNAGSVFIGTTTGTIDSSNSGINLAADGYTRISRGSGAGAGSAIVEFYGNSGQFRTMGNGNAQNTNGSYTTISDAKLKENIVDANSQWDDVKAIKIRKWNYKAETGHETHRQIGPIAQELEEVCPGLVFQTPDRDADGNETGEVTKGVNQSVLYMKAVKALQEAMERIETLEAKVAALEAA